MRKLFALALILGLTACAPTVAPTATLEPTPGVNLRVYNSAWQVVKAETVASRAITSTDAVQLEVDAYNANHTDDQWRILYGADEVPIASAPDAQVYIVAKDSHKIFLQADIARSDLEARRDAWRLTVDAWSDEKGQLVPAALYVDNVPPAPVATPAPDPYVIYALYEIDKTGTIICEDHPTEADYPRRLEAFKLDVELQNYFHPENPYSLITGRLYP